MKKHPNILLMAALALGLSAASQVSAEQPKAPEQERQAPEGRAAFHAKKIEALHGALKLAPAQEAAWNEWAGKMKPDEAGRKARRHEGWANLTAIERMEKKLEFGKERQTKLEARLAATKTFYATLGEEQRKVFDKEFVFHGRGHGEGHGRGGKWREDAE